VSSLGRSLLIVALLGLPLLVVIELPRFLDLAASVPAPPSDVAFVTPEPSFRLLDVTPTPPRSRYAPLDDSVPPTLSPPVATATAAPTPRPTATGERVVIGNTGGLGAILRANPVTGSPVAALRDQQVLDVLERRNVPGSGDWVHVRTADGKEGWVTGIVARPLPTASN
jgi:SH3 domain-containing protein